MLHYQILHRNINILMQKLQVYPSFRTLWGERVHVSQMTNDSFVVVIQHINLKTEINYFATEPELLEYLDLLDQNRRY